MAATPLKPSPSKELEPPSQQLPHAQHRSDAAEPETPTKQPPPDQNTSDSDKLGTLGQSSSPELQLSLQNFNGKEVPETPVQNRQRTSQTSTTDSLRPSRQSEKTPLLNSRASSNPYRLVAEQLSEPDVSPFGEGPVVDPFGVGMARDNQRWLGGNSLEELVGRVSKLEEEVARRVYALEKEIAKVGHGG